MKFLLPQNNLTVDLEKKDLSPGEIIFLLNDAYYGIALSRVKWRLQKGEIKTDEIQGYLNHLHRTFSLAEMCENLRDLDEDELEIEALKIAKEKILEKLRQDDIDPKMVPHLDKKIQMLAKGNHFIRQAAQARIDIKNKIAMNIVVAKNDE